MTESQIVRAIEKLTEEIRKLRGDVDDVKKALRLGASSPKEGIDVPPWLRFEVMESLARADKPMSTKEIAESINERRGMVGEKTSRGSVSRAVSELAKKDFVVREQVGRRIFYRLTGKARVLYVEGDTLEEATRRMTEKVIEANGRECSIYMMSILTPDMRKDIDWISDQIFQNARKKSEISVKASSSYTKSEISLLLIP